jgi:hypothetical protein
MTHYTFTADVELGGVDLAVSITYGVESIDIPLGDISRPQPCVMLLDVARNGQSIMHLISGVPDREMLMQQIAEQHWRSEVARSVERE